MYIHIFFQAVYNGILDVSDHYVFVYKQHVLQRKKFTSYHESGRPDAALTDFVGTIFLLKVWRQPADY